MRPLIRQGGKTIQGPQLISDKRSYVADAGQTEFSVNYSGGNVDVYRNGLRLDPSDYAAASGSEVVLLSPCDAGDIVSVVGGGSSTIADAYSRQEVDSKLSGKASTSHTHGIEDVAGLSDALSGKASLNATSTAQGGLKARLNGTTLYLTNNGNNA